MIYKKVKELYPQIKTIANEHVEKNGCPAECVDEHFTVRQSSLQNV